MFDCDAEARCGEGEDVARAVSQLLDAANCDPEQRLSCPYVSLSFCRRPHEQAP